jgi:hypothetical protein
MFTPGAPNSVRATSPAFPLLWLNEVQPNNVTGVADRFGHHHPWVELYNSDTNAINLTGYYLADNFTNLAQWAFPPNTMINPGQFLVVYADGNPGESTNTELHTSFGISPVSGSVALSETSGSQMMVIDYLNYNLMTADHSYGAFPDGTPARRQRFYYATPGGTNNNVYPTVPVFINEWMAKNGQTIIDTADGKYHDWFELYNGGPIDIDLSGYTLTDSLTDFAIPAGYTIAAGGYVVVWADNTPSANSTNDPALHVNFKLSAQGSAIGLLTPSGTVVDSVAFGAQTSDISEGRWPDGNSGSFYFMPVPTPGSANTVAASNSPPVLAEINDLTVNQGSQLTFIAAATDPDTGQALTFTLDSGAPVGATINPNSGLFVWTPSGTQDPGVYSLTVHVTDNGLPPLSDAKSLTITVIGSTTFRATGVALDGTGNVTLTWDAESGKTYRVLYKTDLNQPTWTPLVDLAASGLSLSVIDSTTGDAQRYYLIQMLIQ